MRDGLSAALSHVRVNFSPPPRSRALSFTLAPLSLPFLEYRSVPLGRLCALLRRVRQRLAPPLLVLPLLFSQARQHALACRADARAMAAHAHR